MNFFYKFVFVLAIFSVGRVFSQVKISNASGSWSNSAIWTPTGVPTSTNDVIISNGNTVTISSAASCSNLTIGNGAAAAQVHFLGNTAQVLTVGGDITVNALSTFSVASTSNVTHSLLLSGNLVNNGIFRLFQDGNSLCNISFVKNGNQSISGSGSLTRFNRITLNMGTSPNNVLEVSSTSFTTINNFLTLSNGTFKLSTPNAATVVPFTAATTIQATSGIWLNSPVALMSFSANVALNGLLRVSSGYMDVGNANNEDLTPNGGTLTVEGGTLDIAGKYNASSAATTFNFTGGTILVTNNASTNTTISPFHLSASGSSFNMSGGTLILRREGGTGAQDLGFVNTGSTGGSVTGGTIQFGYSNTPANQTICVNSTFTLPSISVNSASVTVKLLTNSLTVLKDITINSGILLANNFGIALGGNWTNTGSFTPGTGTVSFNGATGQSILKSGGETFNNLLFSGSGTKTFASAITTNGSFSISAGSPVDVSASNFSLAVKGNFINNGSLNARKGLVLLNGTTSQSISGTSATTFYNLSLSNTAGAVLGSDQNLEGTLQLNNGTFNTNSKVFTLVSNSLTTGRIGQIAGSGDISGNVTVQRFIPGGSTGWAFMGTPISSALTFNDWDDDIFISCPTCPDGYVSNFSSIYAYDETQSGLYDDAASYVPISSINDAIVGGKGYWVYVGTGLNTTADITKDVTGTVRKFNYSIPLNYTNTGSLLNDGWNLISNPYPSAISWAALKGSTANIDDAIYVYNADLNSGTGGTAAYVNGVSSPAVSSGGIDDNIAMCQGFFVHSTGATALNAQESNKVANNPTFLKPAASVAGPLLRLNLSGPGSFNDEVVLYQQQNASKGFETGYDAYKMRPNDPLSPFFAISYGGDEFQINGVGVFSGAFSIPLKATTGTSGNFTINALGTNSFPFGTCINLFDKWTSTSTNLLNSDYAFYLPDTTTAARFEIHITLNSLSINSQVNQPGCQWPAKGYIAAMGANQGPWNYRWKTNNTVLKTSLLKAFSDTLDNLSGGLYTLEVNTAGQCDNNTSTFYLAPKTPVTALFQSIDTLFLGQSSDIQFTNLSANATSYFWDSGFGSINSNAFSPLFTYSQAGEFTVKLICTNSTGCVDSMSKKLMVFDGLNSLVKNTPSKSLSLKTLGNNHFIIEGNFDSQSLNTFYLYDSAGKLLINKQVSQSGILSVAFNLESYPKGIYFITVSNPEEQQVIKVLVD